MWGEARFPLIVFLHGRLTNYTWYQFCDAFAYNKNWNPAGNTYRIPPERMSASRFGDELDFVEKILGGSLDESDRHAHDFMLLDQIETNLETEEGRELLRQHIVRERSASLIAKFKATYKPLKCEVCAFDFATAYGDLGKGFIEAHHVKPLADMSPETRQSWKISLRCVRTVIGCCTELIPRCQLKSSAPWQPNVC